MQPSKRFLNKVALVTGAGSGIGRATAERLAREGAFVVGLDVSEQGLDETRRMLLEAGGEAEVHPCDVTDEASVDAVIRKVAEHHGGLDVVVNAAGIGRAIRFEDLTLAEWDRVLRVNLFGPFLVTHAALPHMLGRPGANIVNVSSIAGLRGQAYNTAYCASKAGLLNFTRALALEFATRGLRANCVCPGGVKTPLVKNFVPDSSMEPHLLSYAMPPIPGKWGKPADVAAAIAFLASDEAQMINGAALVVDFGVLA
ncbi:MAG: 3-oxoacyl-[acyl-carrier-protein] reductase FabG [Candidatus Binatia bacterium]|nr:MAG: 3-oxoacyl-[acyl-carrier-protein] reductase FabG [Candidatus Binatia bacterium]